MKDRITLSKRARSDLIGPVTYILQCGNRYEFVEASETEMRLHRSSVAWRIRIARAYLQRRMADSSVPATSQGG